MKNQHEIAFARREIDRAMRKTPYGDALATPWVMLREALDEIERLRNERDQSNRGND